MECRFLDFSEEIGFFVTALEEDGFSLSTLNLKEEEDADFIKQMI